MTPVRSRRRTRACVAGEERPTARARSAIVVRRPPGGSRWSCGRCRRARAACDVYTACRARRQRSFGPRNPCPMILSETATQERRIIDAVDSVPGPWRGGRARPPPEGRRGLYSRLRRPGHAAAGWTDGRTGAACSTRRRSAGTWTGTRPSLPGSARGPSTRSWDSATCSDRTARSGGGSAPAGPGSRAVGTTRLRQDDPRPAPRRRAEARLPHARCDLRRAAGPAAPAGGGRHAALDRGTRSRALRRRAAPAREEPAGRPPRGGGDRPDHARRGDDGAAHGRGGHRPAALPAHGPAPPAALRRELGVLLERGLAAYAGRGARSSPDEAATRNLIGLAAGDGRRLLSLLEGAVTLLPPGRSDLDAPSVLAAAQSRTAPYDRSGAVSAMIKSIRGGDEEAALYWLAVQLAAGDDGRHAARRLVVAAGEEVGAADPAALPMAVACLDAVERVGLPEAHYPLAATVSYLARTARDWWPGAALHRAVELAETGADPVPPHLRPAAKTYRHPAEDAVGAAAAVPAEGQARRVPRRPHAAEGAALGRRGRAEAATSRSASTARPGRSAPIWENRRADGADGAGTRRRDADPGGGAARGGGPGGPARAARRRRATRPLEGRVRRASCRGTTR